MAKDEPQPEPVTYTPITAYTPELLALNVNVVGSNGSMRWDPSYADYWLASKNGQPVPQPGGLQVDDPAPVVDPPAVNPPSP